jgi:hypothetical protein
MAQKPKSLMGGDMNGYNQSSTNLPKSAILAAGFIW